MREGEKTTNGESSSFGTSICNSTTIITTTTTAVPHNKLDIIKSNDSDKQTEMTNENFSSVYYYDDYLSIDKKAERQENGEF